MSEYNNEAAVICNSCHVKQMKWVNAWANWCGLQDELSQFLMNSYQIEMNKGCCFE